MNSDHSPKRVTIDRISGIFMNIIFYQYKKVRLRKCMYDRCFLFHSNADMFMINNHLHFISKTSNGTNKIN
jgi:hypothetical protein